MKLIVFTLMFGAFGMNATNQFTFKKISEDDIPQLLTWFQQPHVIKWWPVPEKNELIEKFLRRIRSKDTFGYVVFLDKKPIGYIQYYYLDYSQDKAGKWLPELPYSTVGTDQFIGEPDYIGKGYGTLFIKAFIEYLKTIEPDLNTIIVDPEPGNIAAIRCYEKVGFERVGIFETPYGTSLLMWYDL
jgi:RimJ/RimL family protein N-acetyltransferase